MTAELRELYQSVIIDHGRHPRNFGALANANHHHEGFNPLCGDRILIHAQTQNDRVEKIMFEGSGCAISMASASLMSDLLLKKTRAEIETVFADFHQLITTGHANQDLGKLRVMSGVHEFPLRVKCATLAWHALLAALRDVSGKVTTEDEEPI